MLVEREGFPTARACRLLNLPRSSFYYSPGKCNDREVVTAIEAVLEAFTTYGTRRVSQQLRRPPHFKIVNRK
jgi:hypothetical protein